MVPSFGSASPPESNEGCLHVSWSQSGLEYSQCRLQRHPLSTQPSKMVYSIAGRHLVDSPFTVKRQFEAPSFESHRSAPSPSLNPTQHSQSPRARVVQAQRARISALSSTVPLIITSSATEQCSALQLLANTWIENQFTATNFRGSALSKCSPRISTHDA